MFRILPLRGRMAWVVRSRPCFALPAAESPSTMKISPLSGSRVAQSASLPGRTVEVRRLLRLTMSLAAFAAMLAACAACAFSTIRLSTSGLHSKSIVSSVARTASMAGRTSGLPRRPLVWPSNSGSITFTATMAVRPSLMNSPGILPASALIFPLLSPHALTVLVMQFLRPSTWLPPSLVLMLLQKERILSLYMSEDQRRATEMATGGVPLSGLVEPAHIMLPPSSLRRCATFSADCWSLRVFLEPSELLIKGVLD
mmetsp:Transcript_4301/g.8017  ORF Transcript_4301/g.8017 Transcript_4301/m.8017 type:complete len:256 (-) Transcript_4301:935-1702(-)